MQVAQSKNVAIRLSLYRGATTGLHFFGLLEPWYVPHTSYSDRVIIHVEQLPNSILCKHYKFQFKSAATVQKQLQSLVEKKAPVVGT